MCKKLLMLMISFALAGVLFCMITREDEEDHPGGSSVVSIGDEVVSVFVDGVDYTQEYREKIQRAKESVARYFNKECSEIKYKNFCMLEMEGMTIEAEIGQEEYTFVFSEEGQIVSVRDTIL